jgi:RNA polymerase-interacting CarD/CdnL/TRCF family regulator
MDAATSIAGAFLDLQNLAVAGLLTALTYLLLRWRYGGDAAPEPGPERKIKLVVDKSSIGTLSLAGSILKRKIITAEQADRVVALLRSASQEEDGQSLYKLEGRLWAQVKLAQPEELARVSRWLHRIKSERDLSELEHYVLTAVDLALMQEIARVKGLDEDSARQLLNLPPSAPDPGYQSAEASPLASKQGVPQ